jgi:hypothetical protein
VAAAWSAAWGLRKASGLRQDVLAVEPEILYGWNTFANVERGRQHIGGGFCACDRVPKDG